jgi:hypothetical protein
MRKFFSLTIIVGLVWYGFTKYQAASNPDLIEPKSIPIQDDTLAEQSSDSQFSCDGRTHCSQMRSCEEATYFIQHCPNTKMDGNNDGVPCERQWCK